MGIKQQHQQSSWVAGESGFLTWRGSWLCDRGNSKVKTKAPLKNNSVIFIKGMTTCCHYQGPDSGMQLALNAVVLNNLFN